MGKNRKQKNGVNQAQNCNVIETENLNQELPEDFLTSDDFCLVQKRKGFKKFSEKQDPKALFRSLSDCGKNLGNEDSSKCHTSFWTCKFDGSDSTIHTTIAPDDLELQHSDSELEAGIKVPESNLKTLELENATIKPYLEPSLPNKQELLFKEERTSFSVSENEISNVKASSSKTDVENVTKKKIKKKDHRKMSVEEDVEKILKELEIDEGPVTGLKSGSVIKSSLVSKSKNTQQGKCNDTDKGRSNGFPKMSSCMEENNFGVGQVDLQPQFENNVKMDPDGQAALGTASSCKVKIQKKKEKAKVQLEVANSLSKTECNELNAKESCSDKSGNVTPVPNSKPLKIPQSKNVDGPEKKSRKHPSKKQLALIHEALKKAKEEEERLKKEEEAKRKMAEETERIRQEKLRQEQEKKEKKKLKEKQRKEKMRAEGRLLSKSQKLSRARLEATLAVFRQQGVNVPQISDKKPSGPHGPRLGNCKNFHRKRHDSCQSVQSTDSAVVLERQKSESFSSQDSSGKECLSDVPSSFDSTDELSLMPESDKGHYSLSEESDELDDNICSNANNNVDSKIIQKSKECETGLAILNQVKSSESNIKYRSPVVCVLGHVDTGKTKLLDYIRKTHVQDSEAGGITQQIGATMIPKYALKEKCKMVKDFSSSGVKIPGLLVIDTPGHESFSNLRFRGSSVCDIAVLVVDIMHGLEPQTIESINLLKQSKTPFIVALNKVDRIYGWKSDREEDIECTIKNQSQSTQLQFKKRCQEIILQFANECLNAALFYENSDPRSYVSMVPTSAVTGDGMGNILNLITQLTQSLMPKRLIYSHELEATVLEVKTIPGLGTTIDVILVNGALKEGDTIIIAGQEGPIVTQIRSLLMPQPLKELRVKNPYIEYKVIEGAQGVKLTGKDLEKSLAGLPLFVASHHNMIDALKDEMNNLLHDTMNSIKTSERGVYVQASTMGSLEALLKFLSSSGIPYFNVKIGPVVKKDVMKASIMLEHDSVYAAILAFDVKIERDAQELADSLGVRIFQADIIYHLFDMYTKYRDDLLLKRHEETKRLAVFPCKLRILPEFVFNPRDPIILGVHVEQGTVKEGTPLCVPARDALEIGIVSSVEMGNNKISCAKKGDEVCIKIDPKPGEAPKTYGKHFTSEDLLVSRISRQSIDICKEHFRNELQSNDWHLMVELKKILHIV